MFRSKDLTNVGDQCTRFLVGDVGDMVVVVCVSTSGMALSMRNCNGRGNGNGTLTNCFARRVFLRPKLPSKLRARMFSLRACVQHFRAAAVVSLASNPSHFFFNGVK